MWPKKFFQWLDGNSPKGEVEFYPIINENYESNLPNVFIIGDLTGVPLLKLAVDSGVKVWNHIPKNESEFLDAVIIGAGPSGISCALEGKKLGKKIRVLESNLAFQTIQGYPKGKPIFAEPKDFQVESALEISDGTKESLLDSLNNTLNKANLEINYGEKIERILRSSGYYTILTESGNSFKTNSIILAIGKSGNPNRLGVNGESLPSVFHRFIDPAETKNQDVIVCGGGDSALEAAIASASYAKSVTIVYRKSEFARAKSQNREAIEDLVKLGKLKIYYNATISEILDQKLFIKTESGSKKLPYDSLYVLIGNQPPKSFLNKLGIRFQNDRKKEDFIGLGAMLGFAGLAYFGKASFYGATWFSGLANFFAIVSISLGLTWSFLKLQANQFQIRWNWNTYRNLYLFLAFLYFCFVYFFATYQGFLLFGKYPAFHYTFLYSLTILVFGIRRMYIRRTEYIKWQTSTLIFVQIVFLFLLPEIILPKLGDLGYLGDSESFLRTQVFPNDAYWKAYGFILAWPLSMGVLYDGGLTQFWFIYGLSVTFGVIPILVKRYGKGAYCGWICSCGGLAETLGDEHRQKMPHTDFLYKIEHSGQYILALAFVLTVLKLIGVFGKGFLPELVNFEYVSDSVKWIYDLIVDIGLAGVIGVGLYFMFSGRIWCRAFCPLAALMHIYAKFSNFRIFSDKKKCISCNICTKNCHQGIDVMGFANKGIPMNSVQCVRCSACVSLCPTNVLSFGQVNGGKISLDSLNAFHRKL